MPYRDKPVQRAYGEEKSEGPAGGTDEKALHQMLAQKAQLASSERRPNRLLPASRRCPRHQQVGHVEAGDQQHAARGG